MNDIYRWALGAEPGELKVYHEGLRGWDNRYAAVSREERLVFDKAWQAHEAGLVFLAQRRIRKGLLKGTFQYVAIRVSAIAAIKLGLVESRTSLSYQRAG